MVISHSFVSGLWGHFGFHLIHFDRENTSFFPLSTSSLTSRMEPITCHRTNELVSPNLEIAFILILPHFRIGTVYRLLSAIIPSSNHFIHSHIAVKSFFSYSFLFSSLRLTSATPPFIWIITEMYSAPLLQICIPVHTSSSHHISLPSSFAYLTHSNHHHLILLHLVIIISSSH